MRKECCHFVHPAAQEVFNHARRAVAQSDPDYFGRMAVESSFDGSRNPSSQSPTHYEPRTPKHRRRGTPSAQSREHVDIRRNSPRAPLEEPKTDSHQRAVSRGDAGEFALAVSGERKTSANVFAGEIGEVV